MACTQSQVRSLCSRQMLRSPLNPSNIRITAQTSPCSAELRSPIPSEFAQPPSAGREQTWHSTLRCWRARSLLSHPAVGRALRRCGSPHRGRASPAAAPSRPAELRGFAPFLAPQPYWSLPLPKSSKRWRKGWCEHTQAHQKSRKGRRKTFRCFRIFHPQKGACWAALKTDTRQITVPRALLWVGLR